MGVVPTEPTGRNEHEQREVYRTKECAGCGGLLAAPHVLRFHRPCSCNDGQGHRVHLCRDCGTEHLEPECTDPVGRGMGSAYG